MTKIPFAFGLTNVLPRVIKFGHLGSVIAGQHWDEIVSELFQTLAAMQKLEADHSRFLKYLNADQLLLLKPKHQLDHLEWTRLTRLFGWLNNPIALFFPQNWIPAQQQAQPRLNQACLSLICTHYKWRKTFLVKMETRTGLYGRL
ncbi:hypothetical protein B0H19DRAFT_1079496 [Mycena capillaripes]|nr:hypothetical protein B0H19DRAFT_1079496 [Mycena capillaripes]